MSTSFKRRVPLSVLLAVVTVLAVGAAAYAVTTQSGGGTVTRMYANGSDTPFTTSSTAYVAVPGASRTIVVASGETALVDARFTSESQCAGGVGGNWCSVRILAGATEMSPQSGLDFAFDSVSSPTGNQDNWESNSVERFIALGPGTYLIAVQAAVTNASTSFRLDDFTLIVERSQRSAG